jgi:hypothetical protein
MPKGSCGFAKPAMYTSLSHLSFCRSGVTPARGPPLVLVIPLWISLNLNKANCCCLGASGNWARICYFKWLY